MERVSDVRGQCWKCDDVLLGVVDEGGFCWSRREGVLPGTASEHWAGTPCWCLTGRSAAAAVDKRRAER